MAKAMWWRWGSAALAGLALWLVPAATAMAQGTPGTAGENAPPAPAGTEAAPPAGSEEGQSWLHGFFIAPGISFRDELLFVKQGGRKAQLASRFPFATVAYHVHVSSPDFLVSPHFGYSYAWETYAFRLDHQNLREESADPDSSSDLRRHDLGTEVSGYYSYLIPAVFVKDAKDDKGWDKLGIGLGIGRVELSGTVRFSSNGLNADGLEDDPTRIQARTNTALGLLLFSEWRTRWWPDDLVIRLAAAEFRFSAGGRDYVLNNLVLQLSMPIVVD